MSSIALRPRAAALVLATVATGALAAVPAAEAATGSGTVTTDNYAFDDVELCEAEQPPTDASAPFADDGVPVTVTRSYATPISGLGPDDTVDTTGFSRMRLRATDLAADTAVLKASAILTATAIPRSPSARCGAAAGVGANAEGLFELPQARKVTITVASDSSEGTIGASVSSVADGAAEVSASRFTTGRRSASGVVPAGTVRIVLTSELEAGASPNFQERALAGRITIRFDPVAG